MELNETGVSFTLEELGLTAEQAKNPKYLLKAILENFYQGFPQDRGQRLSIEGGGRAQMLSFPKDAKRWKIVYTYIMTPEEGQQLPSLPDRMYGVDGLLATENAKKADSIPAIENAKKLAESNEGGDS
ncbi:hypothetical protein NG798_00595 [Ancylothrix sp. C2]|uniref:hypothetical protein n=1 Tax=Ancylothrix sp. D3o TaxID=2953691 RepID=UPI0021BB3441|nr:hypothetical protein [Ancylothrix sp. D3o]MCT7948291.1 hypothetical protein [Ancylothrix sp. D3o]